MSDTQHDANFLTGVGLKPTKKAKKAKPEATTAQADNPDDIVFDASLLDKFVLDKTDCSAASGVLFQKHKYPRGDARNSRLHARITSFIAETRKARTPEPAEPIKEKVRSSKPERDLLAEIKAMGLEPADVIAALSSLKAAE